MYTYTVYQLFGNQILVSSLTQWTHLAAKVIHPKHYKYFKKDSKYLHSIGKIRSAFTSSKTWNLKQHTANILTAKNRTFRGIMFPMHFQCLEYLGFITLLATYFFAMRLMSFWTLYVGIQFFIISQSYEIFSKVILIVIRWNDKFKKYDVNNEHRDQS